MERLTIGPSPSNMFDPAYEKCKRMIEYKSEMVTDDSQMNTGETGLSNEGLSCFANSVLQALMNTPQFANLYLQQKLRPSINVQNNKGTKGAITGCLSAYADCLWSGRYKVLNTKAFLEVFSTEVDMDFNGKHEEDAHEFQTLLLDKLAEDVNIVLNPAYSQIDYIAPSRKISGNLVQQKANDYEKRQRAFSSSIVNKIFKIVTCANINCPKCSMSRINFEEFSHLSIGIDHDLELTEEEEQEDETQTSTSLNQEGHFDNDDQMTEHFDNNNREADEECNKLDREYEECNKLEREYEECNQLERVSGYSSFAQSTSQPLKQEEQLEPISIELEQCLAANFEGTIEEADCPACGKQRSPRSYFLWSLPDELIIQLKRFLFKDGQAVKYDRIVDFPLENLDMKPYMHPAQLGREGSGSTLYSLYAIVIHTGNMDSGHYTAYVKNLNSDNIVWRLYDDTTWKVITEEDIGKNKKNAYILYYTREGTSKSIKDEDLLKLLHKTGMGRAS